MSKKIPDWSIVSCSLMDSTHAKGSEENVGRSWKHFPHCSHRNNCIGWKLPQVLGDLRTISDNWLVNHLVQPRSSCQEVRLKNGITYVTIWEAVHAQGCTSQAWVKREKSQSYLSPCEYRWNYKWHHLQQEPPVYSHIVVRSKNWIAMQRP